MQEFSELLKQCRRLRKEGRQEEALGLLRESLRRRLPDGESLRQAGQFILQCLETGKGNEKPLTALILGQCTTSWLPTALAAVAWARGRALRVRDGEYDNIIQDLASHSEPRDVTVLLPWHQRLFSPGSRSMSQRIEDELGTLRQAWEIVREAGSSLVQVGYDWVLPGPMGWHLGASAGHVQLVRRLNQAILDQLPAGAYFLDLEQISGHAGRSNFYDARSYHWTKQPFSVQGVVLLAEHLWAGIRAVTSGPRKVLVLDLDNTLWGGVVGELGPQRVAIGEGPEGEAFTAFQREIRGLSERGVLLAACSKNNPGDAREPFEKNPNMVLSLSHFAGFEACWDPKPLVLRRLAQSLNLGLDSFVFFDDNPAEREHVLQELPEVEVIDVPQDPAEYAAALQRSLFFEAVTVTEEDRRRVDQYRAEQQRREIQTTATSVDGYLRSLEMFARINPVADEDVPRVVQLLAKTNQFNLTTRRHSLETVRRMVQLPGAICLTMRLRDKFGDYGLIAVVLAVPISEETTPSLRIDTLLMSCRTIGRTVEDCLMQWLIAAARERGYRRVVGEYIPTAKNALVAEFYPKFGFRPLPPAGEVLRFELHTEDPPGIPTFVALED